MATAYVARFTRRILGVVGQESRAASPRLDHDIITGMNQDGTGNENGNSNVDGTGSDQDAKPTDMSALTAGLSQIQGNTNGGPTHSDSDFLAELVSLTIPCHQ
jgi:hypothetical protein